MRPNHSALFAATLALAFLTVSLPGLGTAEEADDLVIEEDTVMIEDDVSVEEAEPEPEPPAPAKPVTPAAPAPKAVEPAPAPKAEPAPAAEVAPEPKAEPAQEPKPEPKAAPKAEAKAEPVVVEEDEELITILEEELETPAKKAPPKRPVKPKKPKIVKPPAPKKPAPKPAAAWGSRQKARAFADFLACGFIPNIETLKKYPRIISIAGSENIMGVRGRDVIIQGIHDPGRMLAVFRLNANGCVASYVGLLAVKEMFSNESSVAEITQSFGALLPGNILYPLDLLREEFEQQLVEAEAAEGSEETLDVRVTCMPHDRNVVAARNAIVVVNKGRASGVAIGWTFEFAVADRNAPVTRGRVVRTDRNTSFVRITRLRQIVSVGDRGRLLAN